MRSRAFSRPNHCCNLLPFVACAPLKSPQSESRPEMYNPRAVSVGEMSDQESFEPYVGPEEAAKFLQISPHSLKELARRATVPVHPIGDGIRRRWRFLKSELDSWLRARGSKPC